MEPRPYLLMDAVVTHTISYVDCTPPKHQSKPSSGRIPD